MLVSEVKGIGPKKAALLGEMGIVTLQDMLAHYPHSYEDRSRITPVAEAPEGTACYISVTILKILKNFARGRKKQMLQMIPVRSKLSSFMLPIMNEVFRRGRSVFFTEK